MFRKFFLVSALIIGGHCVPSPMFTTVAMAQEPGDGDGQTSVTLTVNSVFILGVDIQVDGQSMHVAGGQVCTLNVRPNSAVHVSAFACPSCDFNMGNGGNFEIYSPAAFVIASRYLGNQ